MIYINRITNLKPKNERTSYPYSIPIIEKLDVLKFRKNVTFIIGENGTGKSTLMEAIAINAGFNAEGGGRNFNFHTKKSHSDLFSDLQLSRLARYKDGYFLRAESFYNVASTIDELDDEPSFGAPIKDSYGGKSLHEQSHGESFLSLLKNRFFGDGLYILDEPEAALSVGSQFSLLVLIKKLVETNSQFIIATHSPILMAYPDAEIYTVTESGLQLINYEDTEQYKLTKYFINNHQKMLEHLGL